MMINSKETQNPELKLQSKYFSVLYLGLWVYLGFSV